MSYWRHVVPLLTPHYTFVAVDNRGFGGSQRPPTGYDTATMAGDVAELATHLGFERFRVAGEDWGAAIAYAVAAFHRPGCSSWCSRRRCCQDCPPTNATRRSPPMEARLQAGQHEQVAADAEVAVAKQPLREQRWAIMMLALYRCGRQADALRAYQRLRTLPPNSLASIPRSRWLLFKPRSCGKTETWTHPSTIPLLRRA